MVTSTPGAPAFPPAAYDESLRDLKYYRYKRVAESGPERGRELYYFKCWQCHNEFQTTAPQLKGLYQNGTLISGEPVNDTTLSERIVAAGHFQVIGRLPMCRGRQIRDGKLIGTGQRAQ